VRLCEWRHSASSRLSIKGQRFSEPWEVIFALGFRCRVAVSPSMVVATLNTTGEDRIEDSAPFSAAVVHIMDEVYGCSLPASPKKNRM
jgi:hypothetical protein